jgi:hypothetical protein
VAINRVDSKGGAALEIYLGFGRCEALDNCCWRARLRQGLVVIKDIDAASVYQI